jgi:hypothetical protein
MPSGNKPSDLLKSSLEQIRSDVEQLIVIVERKDQSKISGPNPGQDGCGPPPKGPMPLCEENEVSKFKKQINDLKNHCSKLSKIVSQQD